MRMVDLILKKRDGEIHTREELQFMIDGYVDGTIGDEQISAWLMAVYFRGMTEAETADLTDIMQHSGDVLTYTDMEDIIVDKHSTGGVGDKTTLVVAPLVISEPMFQYRTLYPRPLPLQPAPASLCEPWRHTSRIHYPPMYGHYHNPPEKNNRLHRHRLSFLLP